MQKGRTLTELAAELQRQEETKRDFVASTTKLNMNSKGSHLALEGIDDAFEVTNHCHSQIGQRLNIPKKYYEKMRVESPQLLAHNVNHWFIK